MKAVFIVYNQAYNEEIVEALAALGQRGFTRWQDIQGKGGFNGFPRLGSHAWPEMNHAVLLAAVVDASRIFMSRRRTRHRLTWGSGLSSGVLKLSIKLLTLYPPLIGERRIFFKITRYGNCNK